MKVNAMISVIPIGVGTSLSEYIAACERELRARPVNAQLHAQGTNVEGEWEEVIAALRACIDAVHAMGAPRVSTLVKLGTRTDRESSMDAMVRTVEAKLAG